MTEPIFDHDRLDVYRLSIEYVSASFDVDRQQRTITVSPDPARDPSPMNAGDRMSRIAIGAALENMAQTADGNGWQYRISTTESDATFELSEDYAAGEIDQVLRDRVSNRRKYKGAGLSDEQVGKLRAAIPSESGTSAIWVFTDVERIALCQLISEADSMMLSNEIVRKAFLAKVRFDAPVNAVVEEGLALGTLELSVPDRVALRVMRWIPDFVLKLFGIRSKLRQAALRLAESADGFCLVVSKHDSSESDFQAGRVFQRSWLELTREGFAVQPMMSLIVLRNIRDNGDVQLHEEIGSQRTSQLLKQLAETQSFGEGLYPCGILRFGHADPPTTRAGRLSHDSP